jgi:hypothetical protein
MPGERAEFSQNLCGLVLFKFPLNSNEYGPVGIHIKSLIIREQSGEWEYVLRASTKPSR